MFHSTVYDGALERACVELGVPIFGITADVNAVKLSTKSVRNQLLEEWKKGHGKPEYGGVKFVAEPDAASVEAEAPPAMQLCKVLGDGADQVLTLPSDVRQKWLADPSHAPEWRGLLRKFDAKHGAPLPQQVAAVQAAQAASSDVAQAGDSGWGDIFKDSPKTINDLQKQYNKIAATFAVAEGSGLVCHIVEGPQIYVAAPTSSESFLASQMLLGHGGGIWLLEAKGAKALKETWICDFDSGCHCDCWSE